MIARIFFLGAVIVGAVLGVLVGQSASTPDSPSISWPCCSCGRRSLAPGFMHPSVCHDSCMYPSDGVCDDGGLGSVYSLCFTATDCSDCGPRLGLPPPPPLPPRPPPSPAPLAGGERKGPLGSPPAGSPLQWSTATSSHSIWDTGLHPLWMVVSSLYACWHAAISYRLAGVAATFFIIGALSSVGMSVYSTFSALATAAGRDPACCACSVYDAVSTFDSIRSETIFWLCLGLSSIAPLLSLLHHFVAVQGTNEPGGKVVAASGAASALGGGGGARGGDVRYSSASNEVDLSKLGVGRLSSHGVGLPSVDQIVSDDVERQALRTRGLERDALRYGSRGVNGPPHERGAAQSPHRSLAMLARSADDAQAQAHDAQLAVAAAVKKAERAAALAAEQAEAVVAMTASRCTTHEAPRSPPAAVGWSPPNGTQLPPPPPAGPSAASSPPPESDNHTRSIPAAATLAPWVPAPPAQRASVAPGSANGGSMAPCAASVAIFTSDGRSVSPSPRARAANGRCAPRDELRKREGRPTSRGTPPAPRAPSPRAQSSGERHVARMRLRGAAGR